MPTIKGSSAKKATPKKKKTTTRKPRSDRKMTQAVFNKVCKQIESTHEGLNTICKRLNSSSSAFYDFLDNDKDGKKADRYARARERQAEYLFDKQREVAFDRDEDKKIWGGTRVSRDRLIADTLKWQASKLNGSKYGDKVEVEQKGEVTVSFKNDSQSSAK